jgi:hypothetical protein
MKDLFTIALNSRQVRDPPHHLVAPEEWHGMAIVWFEEPCDFTSVPVYWFDDMDRGGCHVPAELQVQ